MGATSSHEANVESSEEALAATHVAKELTMLLGDMCDAMVQLQESKEALVVKVDNIQRHADRAGLELANVYMVEMEARDKVLSQQHIIAEAMEELEIHCSELEFLDMLRGKQNCREFSSRPHKSLKLSHTSMTLLKRELVA